MPITNIITAVVTAYCSCQICCGKQATGINAAGQRPVDGVSIAASRKIPLGSKVIIDGHEYTVDDRLAKRFDDRFDVYMNSHKAALKHGKQKKKVMVITNGKQIQSIKR